MLIKNRNLLVKSTNELAIRDKVINDKNPLKTNNILSGNGTQ
jgi:hypothetical protein